jgi:hypothetical protein
MQSVPALFLLLISVSLSLADDEFRIAFFCDVRGASHAAGCASEENFAPALGPIVSHVLKQHRKSKIELLISPGDLMAGVFKRDADSVVECNRIQLKTWRDKVFSLMDAGIAVRVTLGNHEAVVADESRKVERCGAHSKAYVVEKTNFAMISAELNDMVEGEQGPAADMGFTYSFDRGPCHFVMLNAYTLTEHSSFTNETLKWLIGDLEKAKAAGKLIFVASHSPAFPGGGHTWDSLPFFDKTYDCDYYDPKYGKDLRRERDRFWNILKQFGVVAYLCGHEHNIQVQEVEGVWHVISGGVPPKLYPLNGAPDDKLLNNQLYDGEFQNPRASQIWPWNDKKQRFWGWCLIRVNSGGVEMDVYGSETPPNSADAFKVVKTFTLRGPK